MSRQSFAYELVEMKARHFFISGFGVFTKGLTARMTASVIYSICIIFGYETVKRWSVHEELKEKVKW